MISNDLFSASFGLGIDPLDDLAAFARNAVRNGFALVPVEPLGKAPICTLTARSARIADLEAQARGERKHACGIYHALTDPTEAGRVFGRLSKERPGLNVGIECGRSRMILADCDNAESVAEWDAVWMDHNDGAIQSFPTVLTPGRQLADGTWAHKDGAHFWYSLPEDYAVTWSADSTGSMQLDGGVSISWHSRQALVPPSVRAEGAYRLVGKVEVAPDWLLDMIADKIEADASKRVQQAAKMAAQDGVDPIDAWSAQTAWADLLLDAGWQSAVGFDSCGPACEIWTRPGAANAKSATAHEPGCMVTTTEQGWGPIHIWSDDAAADLGSKHLSKLQFYAVTNNLTIPEAMSSLGLASTATSAVSAALDAELEAFWVGRNRPREADDQEALSASGSGSEPRKMRGGRVDLLGLLTGTLPPSPVPSILGRSDGNSLFYLRTINQLIGESEGGKTWAALAACAHVLKAGLKAAYVDIDGNGDPALIGRLEQLEVDVLACVQEDRLAFFRPTDPDEFRDMVKIITKSEVTVCVVDSFGEAMPIFGLKTNDNDDATTFMANYLTPMALAGTAVIVIDHVTKDRETRNGTGIGAQAKKRRTDGAYVEVVIENVFSRRNGGSAKLFVRKDRHSGLNDATAADRYWGTFRLIPGGGYSITSAVPAAPEEAIVVTQAEVSEDRKVLLSKVLEARKDLPEDMRPVSSSRLKQDGVGFDSSKVKATLESLLASGHVQTIKVGRTDCWVSVKPYEALGDLLDAHPVYPVGPGLDPV